MWREGLGAYSIIMNDKKGYSNHPAVVEFKPRPDKLWERLRLVRKEAIKRGYNFKELPEPPSRPYRGACTLWQSLEEQKEVLRSKKCDCNV